MVVKRSVFFLALFIIVTTPFLIKKTWWLLHAQKTTGTMGFIGKSYTGQIPHVYSCIRFMANTDTVWFNCTDNVIFKPGEAVPVLYQPANPRDARVNIFADLWGDTVVYGGIPAMIILVISFHPYIVPFRRKIKLTTKKPFIQLA